MSSGSIPVIAIDGPSGTGKGSLGVPLARTLGWHFLDSGALYRTLGWLAMREAVAFDDVARLGQLAARLGVEFRDTAPESDEVCVICRGEDVTRSIRSEACARAASEIAVLPSVRAALLAQQRAFRQPPGLVADGRDMGTAVFADAMLKIYLSASPEERAERRYKQLKDQGVDVNLRDLLEGIMERDARDSERGVSPLRAAPDAVIIDTTRLDRGAVFERVIYLLDARDRRADNSQ
ncbi:MAG: (d)CMP kinase [Gammaproteobacteria bacterium]